MKTVSQVLSDLVFGGIDRKINYPCDDIIDPPKDRIFRDNLIRDLPMRKRDGTMTTYNVERKVFKEEYSEYVDIIERLDIGTTYGDIVRSVRDSELVEIKQVSKSSDKYKYVGREMIPIGVPVYLNMSIWNEMIDDLLGHWVCQEAADLYVKDIDISWINILAIREEFHHKVIYLTPLSDKIDYSNDSYRISFEDPRILYLIRLFSNYRMTNSSTVFACTLYKDRESGKVFGDYQEVVKCKEGDSPGPNSLLRDLFWVGRLIYLDSFARLFKETLITAEKLSLWYCDSPIQRWKLVKEGYSEEIIDNIIALNKFRTFRDTYGLQITNDHLIL